VVLRSRNWDPLILSSIIGSGRLAGDYPRNGTLSGDSAAVLKNSMLRIPAPVRRFFQK
jgi:hypothetical protein